MDVLKKLQDLQAKYGWTDYKIAKESGLSPNTISNIYKRGNQPSISTLEAICKAFGITMGQFFCENETVELTPEVSMLIEKWNTLDDMQKAAIWQVMNSYK